MPVFTVPVTPSCNTMAETETVIDKKGVLDAVLKVLNKQFGAGTVLWADASPNLEIDKLRTNLTSLDRAIGGGIPRGRIIELYGHEGSGKSTLALTLVASCQAQEELVAYIDMEHALDFSYMQTIGVDNSKLILSQPDTAEEALDILQALVKSGSLGLIVVDSVAALVPQKELEGETGDATIGLVARFMSKSLRKITPSVGKSDTAVVFINQVRDKIGSYVPMEVTTGGRSLAFASSLRIEMKRGAEIKEGDTVLGVTSKLNIRKNKVAPPGVKLELPLLYGFGFDKFAILAEEALRLKVIRKSGSWFEFGELKEQGLDKLIRVLHEQQLEDTLEQAVLDA